MTWDGDERVALVARRLGFLELLSEERLEKPAIAARLDCSRSTVDRGIRELAEAGLIERTEGGYATTLAGRIAVDRYRAFRSDSEDVFDAAPVLAALPADCGIDAAAVAGGEVELAAGPAPYRPVERVHDAIRKADRYRAVLPVLEDPRHLRLCYEHVVSDGGRADLVVDGELLGTLREEFPRQLDVLADTDRCAIRAGDVPPFGIVLPEREDAVDLYLLVFDDDGIVHGMVHNDSDEAVRWGVRTFGRAFDDAAPVRNQHRTQGRDSASLSRELAAEGFVRLSTEYFLDRSVADPMDAWRVGFGLPEVQAGYPIDRTYGNDDGDDADGSLREYLLSRLRDGVDCAVIGPPGAGKSTICKQVACEWYRTGDPVFYRESGRASRFESVGSLVEAVRAADGHPLVVVEDAVRPEASAVFEAIAEADAAAFLLDARQDEWAEPTELTDDRIDPENIETVTIPQLLGRDCDRLIERFERTVGYDGELPAERIREDLEAGEPDRNGSSPGEALLFTHRLLGHVDPPAGDPTTLEQEVRSLYEDLDAIGRRALDVGTLVNLLNAAGLPVFPEYVRGLAGEESQGSGPGTEPDAVEAALDELDGRVLFGRRDTDGFRTVHETWSGTFLAVLLGAEGDAAAERTARVLSRLLALADDGQGEAGPPPLGDAPGEWVRETLEDVYAAAEQRPELAGLLPGGDALALPSRAPPDTRVLLERWRGHAHLTAGDGETAAEAFRAMAARLDEVSDRLPEERVRSLGAATVYGRGRAAMARGDHETAERAFERALEAFRAIDDATGESDCLNSLGIVADRRGNWETAIDRFERSLDLARAIDDERRIASRLLNLGVVRIQRGDHRAAESCLTEALEGARRVGSPHDEAQALNNLGMLARDRGDLSTAQDRFREALERRRELGMASDEALALWNLAEVARRRGELADAAEYAERARDRYGDVDDELGVANSLVVLAHVRHEDEPESAVRLARRALGTLEDGADRLGEASARIVLAKALRADGSLTEAERQLDRASDLCERLDTPLGRAWCLRQRGLLAADRGRTEQAEDHLQESLDLAKASDLARTVADVGADLGRLALERDRPEPARDRLVSAVEAYRGCDAPRLALETLDLLADVCEGLGDHAAAVEHCKEAVDIATRHGLTEETDRFRERCRRLERVAAE